ncbi:MAG: hypothetical protein Q4D80_03655 [Pseudomonadota bacterium]|nr:hypothetical protein [Pseudomonadota bacterium]
MTEKIFIESCIREGRELTKEQQLEMFELFNAEELLEACPKRKNRFCKEAELKMLKPWN